MNGKNFDCNVLPRKGSETVLYFMPKQLPHIFHPYRAHAKKQVKMTLYERELFFVL
jgi:hypothetical protein